MDKDFDTPTMTGDDITDRGYMLAKLAVTVDFVQDADVKTILKNYMVRTVQSITPMIIIQSPDGGNVIPFRDPKKAN